MTAYTAHAQIVEEEHSYGSWKQPTEEQLKSIEAYREQYRQAFGVYPAGSHWIDDVRALVRLLRPGGIS